MCYQIQIVFAELKFVLSVNISSLCCYELMWLGEGHDCVIPSDLSIAHVHNIIINKLLLSSEIGMDTCPKIKVYVISRSYNVLQFPWSFIPHAGQLCLLQGTDLCPRTYICVTTVTGPCVCNELHFPYQTNSRCIFSRFSISDLFLLSIVFSFSSLYFVQSVHLVKRFSCKVVIIKFNIPFKCV